MTSLLIPPLSQVATSKDTLSLKLAQEFPSGVVTLHGIGQTARRHTPEPRIEGREKCDMAWNSGNEKCAYGDAEPSCVMIKVIYLHQILDCHIGHIKWCNALTILFYWSPLAWSQVVQTPSMNFATWWSPFDRMSYYSQRGYDDTQATIRFSSNKEVQQCGHTCERQFS